MAFKSAGTGGGMKGLKKPKFGGKPVTKELPPDKKIVDSLGGSRPKTKGFEERVPGNKEFGFIQATPKQATAAMMGRAPPKMKLPKGAGPKSKNSRKQFKPKGAKVF